MNRNMAYTYLQRLVNAIKRTTELKTRTTLATANRCVPAHAFTWRI